MVEVTEKREMMANQLLMRGHASMQEILTASFGEWPPKGLDINLNALPDQEVELKPFLDAASTERGAANAEGKREIKISKENIERKLAKDPNNAGIYSVLGHEGVHILQADHSYRSESTVGPAPLPLEAEALAAAQKKSFFGKLIDSMFSSQQPKSAEEMEAESQRFVSDRIMDELMGHKKGTGGGPVSKFTARNIGSYTNFFGVSDGELYEQLLYLRQGHEIQARIHQIMIDGYQRWGKLPANQDEFLAAMKNSGIKLPQDIEKRLEGLSANSGAKHFLNAGPGTKSQMIADIQMVSNSLMSDSCSVFWSKSMPAIYADLIEMYGDKPGRARFGLGVNPKAENPVKVSQNPVKPKDKGPAL